MKLLNLSVSTNRIFGLDILRAISILMVLVIHGNYYMPTWFAQITKYFTYSPITIFFVLSGYLIGHILIKQLDKKTFTFNQLINFWKNRWFRTLPAYFLVLMILSVFYFNTDESYTILSFFQFATFTQNLIWVQPESFFGEAWSLSIEEWFYFVTPLSIFVSINVLKQKPTKALLISALAIIVIIPIYRYLKLASMENYTSELFDNYFRKQVFTRFDSLMYGIVAAYLATFHLSNWKKFMKVKFWIGLFLLIASKYVYELDSLPLYVSPTFQFCTESLGVFLMLPFLSSIKNGKGVFYKAITYISLTSYSAYLIHRSIVQFLIINQLPIIDMFGVSIGLKSTISYFLYWVLTMGISIIMYKYFEIPTTQLREKVKW